MERNKMIRNSDKYVEDNRGKMIEDLNSGKRKYVHTKTLDKYGISINPKTLQYYHNNDKQHLDEQADVLIQDAEQDGVIMEANQEGEAITADKRDDLTDNHQINNEDVIDIHQDSNQQQAQQERNDDPMTAEMLKHILDQYTINEEDQHRILSHPKKNKNKGKRVLIQQIRTRFNF